MNIYSWLPLGFIGLIPLQVQGTPKSLFLHHNSKKSETLSLLYGPTVTSVHDYWKNHILTMWTSVWKMMSLMIVGASNWSPSLPLTPSVSSQTINQSEYFLLHVLLQKISNIQQEKKFSEHLYSQPQFTINIWLYLLYHLIHPFWEICFKYKSDYVLFSMRTSQHFQSPSE